MITYDVFYDRKKKKTEGVSDICLVYAPATKKKFLSLKKQERKIQLEVVNEEKRELIGIVLEPNVPIYRNDDGYEYNIVFSENVIKELLIGFIENGNQKNANIEHNKDMKIKDVVFFENWIVEDEEKDKSVKYNLEAKKGSWVTKLKVDNEELWNDYIKTGKLLGFSIEGFVELEKIKMNDNMNKVELNDESKSWIEKTLTSIIGSKTKQVEMKKDVKLEDYKEEKEEEEKVKMEGEMSEEMKAEIKKMIEEVLTSMMNKAEEEMKTEMSKIKESVATEMSEIKKENVALKSQIEEVGKQPASDPIKSRPSQLELSKMTPYQKHRELNKRFN